MRSGAKLSRLHAWRYTTNHLDGDIRSGGGPWNQKGPEWILLGHGRSEITVESRTPRIGGGAKRSRLAIGRYTPCDLGMDPWSGEAKWKQVRFGLLRNGVNAKSSNCK